MHARNRQYPKSGNCRGSLHAHKRLSRRAAISCIPSHPTHHVSTSPAHRRVWLRRRPHPRAASAEGVRPRRPATVTRAQSRVGIGFAAPCAARRASSRSCLRTPSTRPNSISRSFRTSRRPGPSTRRSRLSPDWTTSSTLRAHSSSRPRMLPKVRVLSVYQVRCRRCDCTVQSSCSLRSKAPSACSRPSRSSLRRSSVLSL